MGYPMTYKRVVGRNSLSGDYGKALDHGGQESDESLSPNARRLIAGDMRRLETDSRDEAHLAQYAEAADITPEQAKKLLDAFFGAETYATFPGWY